MSVQLSFGLLISCLRQFLSLITYEDEKRLRCCSAQINTMIISWRQESICNIPCVHLNNMNIIPSSFSYCCEIIIRNHFIPPTPRGVCADFCYLSEVANCGWGLFAHRTIPKDSIITCYAGEFISTAEMKKRQSTVYDSKVSFCTFVQSV